ncbi:MAG: hypothetical protein HC765_02470 [Brachymonas sp.]|nr:hypothetical protein [Brachymonas sp.]
MAAFYNLVSTRCRDGNHKALQHWYSDHLQLLLTSPHLESAHLLRCDTALQGDAPDYLCIYEFASSMAFDQFEQGAEKARATELTNAAAGRSSIDITQREQFVRLLSCSWGADSSAPKQRLLLQLNLPQSSGDSLAALRWFNAQLHQARSTMPLFGASLYAGQSKPDLWLAHLELGECDLSQAWLLLAELLQQPASYGQPPNQWQVNWVACAQSVVQSGR